MTLDFGKGDALPCTNCAACQQGFEGQRGGHVQRLMIHICRRKLDFHLVLPTDIFYRKPGFGLEWGMDVSLAADHLRKTLEEAKLALLLGSKFR